VICRRIRRARQARNWMWICTRRADRIVADSLPQCLLLGEIHHAVEEAVISRDKVTS